MAGVPVVAAFSLVVVAFSLVVVRLETLGKLQRLRPTRFVVAFGGRFARAVVPFVLVWVPLPVPSAEAMSLLHTRPGAWRPHAIDSVHYAEPHPTDPVPAGVTVIVGVVDWGLQLGSRRVGNHLFVHLGFVLCRTLHGMVTCCVSSYLVVIRYRVVTCYCLIVTCVVMRFEIYVVRPDSGVLVVCYVPNVHGVIGPCVYVTTPEVYVMIRVCYCVDFPDRNLGCGHLACF